MSDRLESEANATPEAEESPNPYAARVEQMVGTVRDQLPSQRTAKREVISGLSAAIGGVPDGMAGSVLAGVNPVYGLYAAMVGPSVGGLFASTQLLRVTSTSASALAAGAALAAVSGEQRDQALFLMIVLIGLVQLAAGLLRLGRLTQFVSHSVMIGFLTGIAVLIVLGQFENFTGYQAPGPGKIAQAINTARNLNQVDPSSIAIGALALGLMLVLPRTKARLFGTLIALAVPSALVALLNWESVKLVLDVGAIPRGLPMPHLPSLEPLSLDLITAAIAIAAVILVQGAGVAQSVRNPDGKPSDASRDFTAQGVANIAVGLCQGVPVGGSVNQTAFSILAGARSRWTSLFSGLWMALILVVFPGLVERVAMPALAALLIVAGVNIIDIAEMRSIWQTGWAARLPILATFVATLFLSIPVAVGVGVVLTIILHVASASTDIVVHELLLLPDGGIEERPPPKQLPSDAVTVLDIGGSLFFAGARTLERLLPTPRGAARPVVVLRLRGRTSVGATLVDVLDDYADQIDAAGGRLYLSGVGEGVRGQFRRSAKLDLDGPVSVYPATSLHGESSRLAYADAEHWLVSRRPTR